MPKPISQEAVDAEVVESAELAIRYTTGSPIVIVGLDEMRARIAKIAAEYDGVEIPREYLGQAKRERAYLNGLKASIEQRRKDVKREYSAPVAAFELEVKDLLAPLDTAVSLLGTQIKEFESRDKADKKNEIRNHWNEYAGYLTEAVDFELIWDEKWALKSCNVQTAKEAVEARVEEIAKELASLESLNLAYPEDARAEYFATLIFGEAVARSNEIEWRHKKDAEFELKRQEAEEWQRQQVEAAAQRAQEAAERNSPSEETPATTEAVSVDESKPADDSETPQEWKFAVTCTRTQFDGILAYLASVDLHGKAIR